MERTNEIIKVIESVKTLNEYCENSNFSNIAASALQELRDLKETISIKEIIDWCLCGFDARVYMSNNTWYADVFDDDMDEMVLESATSPIEIIETLSTYFDDQFTTPLIEDIRDEFDKSDSIDKYASWDELVEFFESHESDDLFLQEPDCFVMNYMILKALCNPELITIH